jgi:hypothetical protein
MAKNTFSKVGGSTYTCDTCGRGTRYTGAQSLGSKLCPQCFDLAGIENDISDGHTTQADAQAQIDRLMADIRAKGGNPDAEFASLLPKAAQPEIVALVLSAEATLQAIDRVCSRRLVGEMNDADAIQQITDIIGKWTDPK